MQKYISATRETGRAFMMRGLEGKVVMLNLLRFKKIADYSESPELKPDRPISGQEAYRIYIKAVRPLLEKSGGEIIFMGRGGHFLIGPMEEEWDLVLLVRQRSVKQFVSFAEDKEYLKIAGHRTAALEDSRLLPIEESVF